MSTTHLRPEWAVGKRIAKLSSHRLGYGSSLDGTAPQRDGQGSAKTVQRIYFDWIGSEVQFDPQWSPRFDLFVGKHRVIGFVDPTTFAWYQGFDPADLFYFLAYNGGSLRVVLDAPARQSKPAGAKQPPYAALIAALMFTTIASSAVYGYLSH